MMDVLTSEACWALNKEIIKQVTSSWSLFTQLQRVMSFNFLFVVLCLCPNMFLLLSCTSSDSVIGQYSLQSALKNKSFTIIIITIINISTTAISCFCIIWLFRWTNMKVYLNKLPILKHISRSLYIRSTRIPNYYGWFETVHSNSNSLYVGPVS